jgi:hypothetical protein
MRFKLVFPAVTAVLCLIAACADSATETPSTLADAGTDATTKPLPSTKPSPANGDDDDDTTGDDDDAATPNDAGKDATPKDSGPPPPHRYRVFVTKTRYFGDLRTAGGGADGLEGADNLCTKAATDANLGGGTTWKAWVSTTVKNAGERIVDRSPWYLVDKTTVAFQDFTGLTSPPLHRIDQNETGSTSLTGSGPLSNRVWTGTTNAGVLTPGNNCNDWTDQSQGKGTAGTYVESSGAANWTRYALQPTESCNADGGKPWPIYCFEQ